MKKFILSITALMFLALLFNACQSESTPDSNPGLDLSLMDTTVTPANDFFRYVNGAWLDKTEIPADRSRWGSFDELRKQSSIDVLGVLNTAIESKKYGPETDQYKAVSFYETAMDTIHNNKMGIEILKPYLEEIEKMETLTDVQAYIQNTVALGGRGFFDFASFPDLKNSTINAPYLTGGSLGLPERDFYTNDDEESQEKRTKYLEHIVRMYKHLGVEGNIAQEKAEAILGLETQLATAMMTKEMRRNPLNIYNKTSVSDLQELIPSMDWKAFFTKIGAGELDSIIVTDSKYMGALQNTMASANMDDIKAYFTWNELNNAAGFLTQEIDEDNFEFYGKVLSGTETQRPRWERVLDVASGTLGEAIGKLYVDEHFPPEAKEKANAMVANIMSAFKTRINNLDWMTDDTKKRALEKLSSFQVKIGYPDKWKDYSAMDIKSVADGGTYASNMLAVGEWAFADMMSKLGKEVDKTEWGMSPQTVNAYYNPLNNEIVFPAAILQPPFYNYKADAAVNYGGIGAVIGHEISHGFDDQGSRFDANGNMVNWWTEMDRTQFEERNQRLIDQFDAYEPLPGVFVNGRFTLGENIGDLGGLSSSYDGLQKHLADNGRPDDIDGMTAEQRFFMSWGTIWRGKLRDEEMKNRIKTDPHSPGMYRAVGPLSNFEPFYKAFEVKEGDALYRADSLRVKIW